MGVDFAEFDFRLLKKGRILLCLARDDYFSGCIRVRQPEIFAKPATDGIKGSPTSC